MSGEPVLSNLTANHPDSEASYRCRFHLGGNQADVGRWPSGLRPRLVESDGLRDELLVFGDNLLENRGVREGSYCLCCNSLNSDKY